MLNLYLAVILACVSGSRARFITASSGNHHPCGSMHAFQLVKNPRLLEKLAKVRARCLRLHAAAKAFNAPCSACSASAMTGIGPCKTQSMGRDANGKQIVFCRGFEAATLHHKAFRLLGDSVHEADIEGAVVGSCPRGYQRCTDRAPHMLSYEIQHTVYLESDYDRAGKLRNTARAGINVAHWAPMPRGGKPRLFIARPSLPPGMRLNKYTGAISGAPRCADCNGRLSHWLDGGLSKHRMYFYQIFALNNGGAAKARISILIGATETTRSPTHSPTPKPTQVPTKVPTPKPPSTTTTTFTTAVATTTAVPIVATAITGALVETMTTTTVVRAKTISASLQKTLSRSSLPASAIVPVSTRSLMRSNAPLASRTVDDLNWKEAQGHLALQAEARRFVDDGVSGGVCFTSAMPGRFLPGCSLSCASFARLHDAMRVCLKVARKAAKMGKVGCGGIVREHHGHTPYQLRIGRPTARAEAASAAAASVKTNTGKMAQLIAEARGVIPAIPAPLNLTMHSGFDEKSFALGPCVDARYGRKQLLRGRRRFERRGFGAKRTLWRPILRGDANEAQGGVLALSAYAATRPQAGAGGRAGVGYSLYGWFKLPRLAAKDSTAGGTAQLHDTHGEALGGCLACFTTVSTTSNVTTSANPPTGAACLVVGHDAVLRYTIAGQGTVLEWAPHGVASMADGLWHFVAVVRAARTGTLRLFYDGRPVLARQHPNAVHVTHHHGSKTVTDKVMAWRIVLGAGNQNWPMQTNSAFRGELAEWYYWGLGVDTFMLGDEFKHTAMAAQSAPGPAPTAAPTASPTPPPTPPPTNNGNAATGLRSVHKVGWRPARFSGSPFLGLLQLRKLRRDRQRKRAAMVRKANACSDALCVNALTMPERQCVYSSPRRGAYLSGCPTQVKGGCGGYSSLDDARELCDVTVDCGGVTREPGAGSNAFQLRKGSRFVSSASAFDAFAAHEISYRRIGCGMVLPSRDCPLITVRGASVVSVPAGARYIDPGVEAFDATDGVLRAPRLVNHTLTLDAECAVLNIKHVAHGTTNAALGGQYELQRLQHEARAVYRQQRGRNRFVLYFSRRLQGWCFGSKPGGNTVVAFVRSLAQVPDQISPSNIWLVGRTGEVRVSDVGVSFKHLRLAPDLQLACTLRGSLGYARGLISEASQLEPGLAASARIVALGALPGTYTLTWHATNRRGQHECRSAQRTVIVRRNEPGLKNATG